MDYIWTYWPDPRKAAQVHFDLACLALSSAFIARYATPRAVYTNSEGARQIERYGIPVPILCTLDHLDGENPGKFALAKIDTYSRVQSPCTHIDYDVFLSRFQPISSADFCCQSLEHDGIFRGTYKSIHDCFLDEGGILPPEMLPYSQTQDFRGYNMGFVQVNNLDFLHKYAAISRPLFSQMKTVDYGNNALPEQFLFYCMVRTAGIQVDELFPESLWDEPTRDKRHSENGYTHFMGKKNRMKKHLLNLVLDKLEQLAPAIHAAILPDIEWAAYDQTQKHAPVRPCDICRRVLHERLPYPGFMDYVPPFYRHMHIPQHENSEPECEVCW